MTWSKERGKAALSRDCYADGLRTKYVESSPPESERQSFTRRKETSYSALGDDGEGLQLPVGGCG